MSLVVPFSPQPAPLEVPLLFPDPFASSPHPLAWRAATELLHRLERGGVDMPDDVGKMFGVLVVRDDDGQLGYLQAFSGLIADQWDVPGFVAGTCDTIEKDRVWDARVAGLKAMSAQIDALQSGEEAAARAAFQSFAAERERTLVDLRAARTTRRQERRHEQAVVYGGSSSASSWGTRVVDDQKRERRLRKQLCERETALRAHLEAIVTRRRQLEMQRKDRCNEALHVFLDTYVLQNARGERKGLRELFAPRRVPGGAGDCAGPKLLHHAYRHGLYPVALAELWWGAPAKAGDRRAGHYYPACQGKCGTVLPFMMQGLDVAPAMEATIALPAREQDDE